MMSIVAQTAVRADQPALLLLIAATVLLILGFAVGKRRNERIFRAAFRELCDAVKPADQTFTSVGGFSAYHAALVPRPDSWLERVEATVTLLPREALLYLPIGLLIRRSDRLFVTLTLTPEAARGWREMHLIEDRYSRFRGPKIANAEALERRTGPWGRYRFHEYCASPSDRPRIEALKRALREPGALRHVAVVPEHRRIFIFMIPKPGAVGPVVEAVLKWAEG